MLVISQVNAAQDAAALGEHESCELRHVAQLSIPLNVFELHGVAVATQSWQQVLPCADDVAAGSYRSGLTG